MNDERYEDDTRRQPKHIERLRVQQEIDEELKEYDMVKYVDGERVEGFSVKIFIIIREQSFVGLDGFACEPVAAFSSRQSALDYIHDLAVEFDLEEDPDEPGAIMVPPHADYVESDEYYVTEMELYV